MARDPVTGKPYEVPADMKYSEWYDRYIKENPEALLVEKKWKNRHSDKKQYERYKETLGKDTPKSFDKFQDLKYNNSEEWSKLKQKYRDTNSGRVWLNSEFPTEKLVIKHYNKHLKEYGDITKEEYLNMAKKLLASPVEGDIDGFKSESGFIFR